MDGRLGGGASLDHAQAAGDAGRARFCSAPETMTWGCESDRKGSQEGCSTATACAR